MATWLKILAKLKNGWFGELIGGSVVSCSNPAQVANSNNGTTTATIWQLFGLSEMSQWTTPIFLGYPSLQFLDSTIKFLDQSLEERCQCTKLSEEVLSDGKHTHK